MQSPIFLTAFLLFAASGATAQTSASTSVESPAFTGERTTTIDPATRSVSRDGTLTRTSDGAVASRSIDRTRTDTGVTIQGNSSNFAGETRSLDYARTRTDTGSTAVGSFKRRNGETVTYQGSRAQTDGSYTAQQTLTGAQGQSLYERTASATRNDAGVTRSVNTTRAPEFRPRTVQRAARRR